MPTPTPTNPPKSILLLGAGDLGTALLHALPTHPLLTSTPLTLLLRPSSLPSPSRLAPLRALSPTLTFTSLDLSAPDARPALTTLITTGGYDTVISCTGFSGPPGTQTLIASAVLDAGDRVQHFLPWQFGVDYDVIGAEAAGGLMAEQVAVRAALRAQGRVAWTIVSTGMFMGFVFEPWFGVVENLLGEEGDGEVVVRALGSWETRVTLTEVGDVGRVVAEVVARPVGERVVFTAGETVSYGELAGCVERVVGGRRRVRREEWSLEFLRGEMERDPESKIKKYRVLFAEGRGVSWDAEKTVNAQRGMGMMGVEEWLRRKLSA